MRDIDSQQAVPVDKRLAMYRNLRDQVVAGLKSDQQEEHRMKMEELDKKIKLLELTQKEREARSRLEKGQQEAVRGDGNKGFLDNIKSYAVEDI